MQDWDFETKTTAQHNIKQQGVHYPCY